MNIFEKCQNIVMLSLLAILLIIAPLLSSSLRTPYLYIVTNLLIVALGAQAGLASAFSKPSDYVKKNVTAAFVAQNPVIAFASNLLGSSNNHKRVVALAHNDDEDQRVSSDQCAENKKPRVIEKSMSEKIGGSVKMGSLIKCPSMPSLFFIGGGDDDEDVMIIEDNKFHADAMKEDQEEEEVGELSVQELFAKSENFIGNFYKQLKMQREDSWKKIHEFCHTPLI